MVSCEDFTSLNAGQQFVEFQKVAKLRPQSLHVDILRLMYWKQQATLFMMFDRDEQARADFEAAVHDLPRNMIYAVTPYTEIEPNFIQLFMLGKKQYLPDAVYIAYVIPGQDPQIEQMQQSLTKQNIVDFAKHFQAHHGWLFEAKVPEFKGDEQVDPITPDEDL